VPQPVSLAYTACLPPFISIISFESGTPPTFLIALIVPTSQADRALPTTRTSRWAIPAILFSLSPYIVDANNWNTNCSCHGRLKGETQGQGTITYEITEQLACGTELAQARETVTSFRKGREEAGSPEWRLAEKR
jgi:hypothetical protein